MSTDLIEQLRATLRGTTPPLIICGSGTSSFASNGAAPSWTKLLQSGVERAFGLGLAKDTWRTYALEALQDGHLLSMLRIADDITSYLGPTSGELIDWLNSELGALNIQDRSLFDAIEKLGCPIATTNYDTLLSTAFNRPPVTWRDYDAALDVLKGKRQAILHLHGVYTDPTSIILGSHSYDNSLRDARRNIISHFCSLLRPTLLIGCSEDGISDPDFTELRRISQEWPAASERRYWLVRNDGRQELGSPLPNERLFPVSYGTSFADLVPFVRGLTSHLQNASKLATNDVRSIDQVVPKPQLYGRLEKIRDICEALAARRSVVISGGPGAGKTALAIAALYEPPIVTEFGGNRVYVSLDGEEDSRAILYNLAGELGLEAQGDVPSLLRKIATFVQDNGILAVLDNAESIFEQNFEEAERIAQLLTQIDGVTAIFTLRGAGPILAGALTLEDIEPMSKSASKQQFLAIAGSQLEDDQYLTQLLSSLDGHALSVQLMAAQAKGLRNLSFLAERWETERVAMLRKRGQDEGRLTSVRASFALSMTSPLLTSNPLARRLIGILSELPDGAARRDIVRLLSGVSAVTSGRANNALEVLVQLRLIEPRVDNRIRMLNPLREAAKLDHPILALDHKRLIAKHLSLAKKAMNTTSKDVALVDSLIADDVGNFESVFLLSLKLFGPTDRLFEAMYSFSDYVAAKGRPMGSIWIDAIKKFASAGKYVKAAVLSHSVARIDLLRADITDALHLAKAADPYARRANNKLILSENLQIRGECLRGISDPSAISLFDTAVDLCRSVGTKGNVLGNVLHARSGSYYGAGDIESCQRDLEEALSIYEASHNNLGRVNVLSMLSYLGRRPVIETLRNCIQSIDNTGASATLSLLHANLADFYFWHGRAEEALAAYDRCREYANVGGIISTEAHAMVRTGQIFLALGDVEAGRKLMNDGFDIGFSHTRLDDKALPGWIALRSGLNSETLAEEREQVAIAARMWADVNRRDLIMDWCSSGYGLPPSRFAEPRRDSPLEQKQLKLRGD